MRRPKPVQDIDDAIAWLSFMARFTQGDLRCIAAGILDVIAEMDLEMEELRARCSSLAQKLELLEAKNEKEAGS